MAGMAFVAFLCPDGDGLTAVLWLTSLAGHLIQMDGCAGDALLVE